MVLHKEYLDVILVPTGLCLMIVYHLFLGDSDTGIAVNVIASNIGAATYLASLSIGLSSLIGAWVGSSSSNIFMSDLIYGDRRSSTISIKYISLLAFFLLAFASFIQSTRYFVHANFLMSTPHTDIPVEYVEMAVIRGSNCGLEAKPGINPCNLIKTA
ncbi:hypothetical protein MKW94_027797 [Papaver nudicaule]|uniref:Uncharacterized protein n=1 Tax=Papaver nudicaule TaxID=74823 RepID=A0AA42B3Q0_PAPNU|nr:hypothetical protein [Papaver nudicaule]